MVPKTNMSVDDTGKELTIAHHQIITHETTNQRATTAHGVPTPDDETDTGVTTVPHLAPLQSRCAKIIGKGDSIGRMASRSTQDSLQAVAETIEHLLSGHLQTGHLH